MRPSSSPALAALLAFLAGAVPALRAAPPIGTIDAFAGATVTGSSGDGGPALAALLYQPRGLAADSSDQLYICDQGNSRVRLVGASGDIANFAGTGLTGTSGDGGPAGSATLTAPMWVCPDGLGNVYISDTAAHKVRKVDAAGNITTVAGTGAAGSSGNGGPALAATLNQPAGLCLDGSGNLYIAESGGNRIRKVSPSGTISAVAGTGAIGSGGDGGPATSATLYNPTGLARDSAGNLYVADWKNNRVRRISSGGIISTYAGNGAAAYGGDGGLATAASLKKPFDLALDSAGKLYIADTENHRVRMVDADGKIWTVAGTGSSGTGGDGGPATSAQLDIPLGLALDGDGKLYISDHNSRVRIVSFPTPTVSPTFTVSPTISPTFTASPTSALAGPGGAFAGSEGPAEGHPFVYPNPARKGERAGVAFRSPGSGLARVAIFNERADLVLRLELSVGAGSQAVNFSTADMAAGVYFYRISVALEGGGASPAESGKFLVLK